VAVDLAGDGRTSNKQLAFVEHIYRALKPGGRAAVVTRGTRICARLDVDAVELIRT
jgi:hypothetical protein